MHDTMLCRGRFEGLSGVACRSFWVCLGVIMGMFWGHHGHLQGSLWAIIDGLVYRLSMFRQFTVIYGLHLTRLPPDRSASPLARQPDARPPLAFFMHGFKRYLMIPS